MTKERKALDWKPHIVEVEKGDHSAFVARAVALRVGGIECILLAQTVEDLDLALRYGLPGNPEGLEVTDYQVTLLHSTKVGIVVNEPQPQFDVSDL